MPTKRNNYIKALIFERPVIIRPFFVFSGWKKTD